MKSKLAICDEDMGYAEMLEGYIRSHCVLSLEIQLFTSADTLKAYGDPEQTAVLVLADGVYARFGTCGFDHILILSGTGTEIGKSDQTDPGTAQTRRIYKYQSVGNVVQEIMNLCAALPEGILVQNLRTDRGAERIGFYTPISRALQTTMAITMGQLLGRERRCLYLNLEFYSGGLGLPENPPADLADLIYYSVYAPERLTAALAQAVVHVGDLDLIPPVGSYAQLQEVTPEQWEQFLNQIARIGDYEVLLLDFSEAVRGLFDLMRTCRRIWTITREDPMAVAKQRQYEQVLGSLAHEDILVQTTKVQLPVFDQLPAYPEAMGRGPLAGFVKNLLEKEAENGESGSVETFPEGGTDGGL